MRYATICFHSGVGLHLRTAVRIIWAMMVLRGRTDRAKHGLPVGWLMYTVWERS